ncbi:MAG: hypothetical protein GC185_03100 [Alphaproteobacteria bacterium]|nr:hypothetical protein [Alphaproteobacteria bacterium]
MTTKKAGHPKKKDGKEQGGGNHKIRHALLGIFIIAAIVFALPFFVSRDALPGKLKNSKAVTAYFNRTRGLMHKADEKIDDLRTAAQNRSRGAEAKPAADDAARQKGYSLKDREKLDELITKGTAAP